MSQGVTMKLGFFTAALPNNTLEQAAQWGAESGFQAIEIACWPQQKASRRYAGVTHIDVADLTPAKAKEIRSTPKPNTAKRSSPTSNRSSQARRCWKFPLSAHSSARTRTRPSNTISKSMQRSGRPSSSLPKSAESKLPSKTVPCFSRMTNGQAETTLPVHPPSGARCGKSSPTNILD